MIKVRYALGAILILALLVAGWAWERRTLARDAVDVRRLLLRRNAALQSGNGALYDGLVYFPTEIEKTAALSLARTVFARNQYLRAVAQALGPSDALRVAQSLSTLREFSASDIEACRLVRTGHEFNAVLPGNYQIRVTHTAQGWRIDPFITPLSQVIIDQERASRAFAAAQTKLVHAEVRSATDALRLLENQFR